MDNINRSWCSDCRCYVVGSQAQHIWTKKHQAVIAGPVVRRRSPRRIKRAIQARLVAQEPSSLDDPEPTWKLCRGIPSLEVEAHFEPLEQFARNRAYADGYYVRCRSCHRFYHFDYNQRRAAAAADLAVAA